MHCALIRMKTVAAFLLLVNIKVYKFHKFLHFTTVDFLDQTHIVTVQRLGKIGNNSHVDGLYLHKYSSWFCPVIKDLTILT